MVDTSVETVIQRLQYEAANFASPLHARLMREAADLLRTLQRERDEAQRLADIYGAAVAEWRPIVERAEAAEAKAEGLAHKVLELADKLEAAEADARTAREVIDEVHGVLDRAGVSSAEGVPCNDPACQSKLGHRVRELIRRAEWKSCSCGCGKFGPGGLMEAIHPEDYRHERG